MVPIGCLLALRAFEAVVDVLAGIRHVILLSWERFMSHEPFLLRGPMMVILSPGFSVSRSQPSALRSAFAPPSSACHRCMAPF